MKQTRVIVTLIISLVIASLLCPAIASAQDPSPAVISSYTIENVDGSDVTDGPLMAGATYTITFEVNVGVDLPDTKLSLSTTLEKAESTYWDLINIDYTGVNTSLWKPGQASIDFDAVGGIAQFILKGTVASSYTTEELSNSDNLHFIKPMSVISLTLSPSGDPLDDLTIDVVDQSILSYRQTLTDKQGLLQITGADPTYKELAQSVITLAIAMNDKGYVEDAINLLQTLPDDASNFPSSEGFDEALQMKIDLLRDVDTEPTYAELVDTALSLAEDLNDNGYVNNARDVLGILPGSASEFPDPIAGSSSIAFIIIIIVIAVMFIAVFMLFLRTKSNSSFIQQQIEEEAGRIDVLLVKISKIDKQLANEIQQVKEQLERISGR